MVRPLAGGGRTVVRGCRSVAGGMQFDRVVCVSSEPLGAVGNLREQPVFDLADQQPVAPMAAKT